MPPHLIMAESSDEFQRVKKALSLRTIRRIIGPAGYNLPVRTTHIKSKCLEEAFRRGLRDQLLAATTQAESVPVSAVSLLLRSV